MLLMEAEQAPHEQHTELHGISNAWKLRKALEKQDQSSSYSAHKDHGSSWKFSGFRPNHLYHVHLSRIRIRFIHRG